MKKFEKQVEAALRESIRAREEMIKKSSQLGVPVIDIDGEIVVGFDQETLNKLLDIKET